MTNQGEAGDARGGADAWRVSVPVVRGKEGRLYLKTPKSVGVNDTPNGELLFEIDDRDLEPALKFLNDREADHATAALATEALRPLFVLWDNWVAYQNEWHDIRDGSPPKDFFNMMGTRIGEVRDALARIEAARGDSAR